LTTLPAHRYDSQTVAVRSLGASGRRPLLDDLDKAIIKALQLDSRGIVQVVGVTDPLAMGFGQPAFIGLHVDASRLDEVAGAVAALDEVTYVVVTAGRFDMICEVVCEDNEHLLRVLADQLAKVEGIRSTETMVELRFVKESYRWGTR
jgi:Lrp/AsnC family transcriptional regulator for asnA, asnC and gidA